MKKRLICLLLVLSMVVSYALTIPVFAATQEVTAGFNYNSGNFSTLDLAGKDGFAIDSDGNLVMTMQEEKTSGSQLTLGGSGISGENVRFKMIYTISDATATAEYYGKKSFVQGGGFFDVYKQGKNKGSLQMSTRVENSITMFVPAYETTIYYNTLIVDMNTITGDAEYSLWQCTSLAQAKDKTSLTDTVRQIASGSGTSAAGAGNSLGDFILNTSPITAGTSTDITLYEFSLEKYEMRETPVEFSYDFSNFNTLNLYNKEGFSVNEDGNLVMTMQEESNSGSQLLLGGAGLSGENIRFKMIYTNSNPQATAQYYGNKSFVRGGGFFDLYKQGKKNGSLQMNTRVIYNGDLFNPAYETTTFYNTLIVDMNTVTGKAQYSFWQCTSLEQATGKSEHSDTVRQKYTGVGESATGVNTALSGIILNTSPVTAGTSTDITLYAISLETVDEPEKPEEPKEGFNYDSSNFNKLDLNGKDGFSLNSDNNLVMDMKAETSQGSQLTLGGAEMTGEKIRFRIIYTNSDGTATAQYYGNKSFVRGGGFFDIYKQDKKNGSLQMSTRVENGIAMFDTNFETTVFYNTVLVDMNTVTGEAEYSFWQCVSLEQAESKTSLSDTVRQKAKGTGISAVGAEKALTDFILNTSPVVAGTSTQITVYHISLENIGVLEFSKPVVNENEDGSVTAEFNMKNTTSSDATYVMILAAYGSNNNMLDIITEYGKAPFKTDVYSDEISIPAVAGATEYKAFIWNSLYGLKPLSFSKLLDGK